MGRLGTAVKKKHLICYIVPHHGHDAHDDHQNNEDKENLLSCEFPSIDKPSMNGRLDEFIYFSVEWTKW